MVFLPLNSKADKTLSHSIDLTKVELSRLEFYTKPCQN